MKIIFDYLKYIIFSNKNGRKIHSPFLYNFAIKVLKDSQKNKYFNTFEKLRTNFLKNNQVINVLDLGAGSKKNKNSLKKISDIAKFSLSSPKYCRLFYRLVEFSQSKNILELGTSLGITTLYLNNEKIKPNITTIEGDPTIFNFAKNICNKNNSKIININLDFDSFFCKIANEKQKFDLIFIDGNHTKEATLKYFDYSKNIITEKGIIVFDDIRWSKGMFEAWEIIKNSNFNGAVVDIFKMGIIFLNPDFLEKQFLTHYY